VPLPSASIGRISTLRVVGQGRQAVRSVAAAEASRDAQFKAGALPDSVDLRRSAGGVRLRWNARAHPMVMVRDAETGEVLSLARGGEVHVATAKGELDLVLSDGVRSRAKRVRVQ